MITVSAAQVQELRGKTGAGLMDCKRALEQAGGDTDSALRILREKGMASAAKRERRAASQGIVEAYVHGGGRIGVLVELNCETDFVARNEEFRALARELAMQVAATNPRWVRAEDIPADVLQQEREIAGTLARNEGKPEAAIPRIVEGRVKKFVEESALLEQPYVRDAKRKVRERVDDLRAKVGENIRVRRIARFVIGEQA